MFDGLSLQFRCILIEKLKQHNKIDKACAIITLKILNKTQLRTSKHENKQGLRYINNNQKFRYATKEGPIRNILSNSNNLVNYCIPKNMKICNTKYEGKASCAEAVVLEKALQNKAS